MKTIARLWLMLGITTAFAAAQAPAEFPADPLAALAAMPAEPAVAGGRVVTVLAADGTSATGAIVIAFATGTPDYEAMRWAAQQRYPGDEPRILAALALRGVRYRLDARASTCVADLSAGRVIAVLGDQVAVASCGSDWQWRTRSANLTLRLRPPLRCSVAVTHASGAPAVGVDVGVVSAPGHLPFPSASTDADGRVAFVLVPGRRAGARISVAAATVQPCVSPVPESGAEVRLRLPPCGRVRARLVDGTIPGARLEWSLRSADGAISVAPEPARGGDGRSAVFALVEPGFVGQVVCKLGPWFEMAARVDGVVAGAECGLEVRRDPDVRTMALRLIDPAGQPIAAGMVRAFWQLGGRHGSGATTTAAGWVELVVPDDRTRSGTLRLEVTGAAAANPCLGWIDLEVADVPGRVVVGEVRLQAPAIAGRGRVVDERGAPVSDLVLWITSGEELRQVSTAADGTFLIAMSPPLPESMSIKIDGSSWFLSDAEDDAVSVATGRSDVTLVVRRAARIRFAVRDLPAGVRTLLSLVAVPSDGVGPSVSIRDGLSATELRVPAGTWDIVVQQGRREVHRIAGVRADAGVETHDPRLMDFAWQTFAIVASVRVVGSDGRPSDACTVRYTSDGTALACRPDGGVWRMLVPTVGGRIEVIGDAAGSVPIGLEVGAEEQVVPLAPAR